MKKGDYIINDDTLEITSSTIKKLNIACIPYTERINIKHIIIPSNITDITLLNNTGIEELVIPGSVRYIMDISDNYNLKKVTFEENSNLKIIAPHGFAYCTNLEEVEIPSSVSYVSDNAFIGCRSLKKVSFNKDIKTIDRWNTPCCYDHDEGYRHKLLILIDEGYTVVDTGWLGRNAPDIEKILVNGKPAGIRLLNSLGIELENYDTSDGNEILQQYKLKYEAEK